MRRISLLSFLLLIAFSSRSATLPLYEIKSQDASGLAPQIDATAVVNYANIDLGSSSPLGSLVSALTTSLPFETLNTLYWTNKNILTDSAGFWFNYSHQVGGNFLRSSLASFVNQGTIDGAGKILVYATNITSSGLLLSSDSGIVQLRGNNLQLQGTGIETQIGIGSSLGSPRAFSGPSVPVIPAFYPLSAAIGTNQALPDNYPGGIDLTQFTPSNSFGALPFDAFNYFYTPANWVLADLVSQGFNQVGNDFGYSSFVHLATNITEIVFVGTNFLNGVNYGVNFVGVDPIKVDGVNRFTPANVTFANTRFDSILSRSITNVYTIRDDLGTRTDNYFYRANGPLGLKIPTNYTVTATTFLPTTSAAQVSPGGFCNTANAAYSDDLINGKKFQNFVVTNIYSAYSFRIDPLKLPQGVVPPSVAADVTNPLLYVTPSTNLPGRIEIKGGNVNMARTRLQAATSIEIEATNLVGGVLPQLEAPYINLNLATTTKSVTISNWFPQTYTSLAGTVFIYSTTYSNDYVVAAIVSGTNTFVTNTMLTHILVVEPFFQASNPVTIDRFSLRAADIHLADRVRVNKEAKLITGNLTFDAGSFISFPGDAGASNFVGLLNFTNNGSLSAAGSLKLGVDRSTTLDRVINSGSISAGDVELNAAAITNLAFGSIKSSGYLSLNAMDLELSGSVDGVSAVFISANNLNLKNLGRITSAGELNLQVTNALVDAVGSSLQASRGLSVLIKPVQGDLLNSTINLKPVSFQEVVVTWAGEDRGPSASGYVNNLAIGQLNLTGQLLSAFHFRAAGTANAVYVKNLALTGSAVDVANSIVVDDNVVLYVNSATTNGVSIPVSQLSALSGGKIVAASAAPAPALTDINYPTSLNGQTIALTVEYRGIPVPSAFLTWNSIANTTNFVEFKEVLSLSGSWSPLSQVFSSYSTNLYYPDRINTNGSRIYRVRIAPKIP